MSDKPARVEINPELCKGCELCTLECPKKCLCMSESFNHLGYLYSQYKGEGCTGCGICFYACPEPGTIKVFKKVRGKKDE